MEIKKEGTVVFEHGKIAIIKDFEVVMTEDDNKEPSLKSLLEEYVKEHYIKIEKEINTISKELIDIIWEQLEKYAWVAHKTEGDEQHIYGIGGVVDRRQLEQVIQTYLLKIKGE